MNIHKAVMAFSLLIAAILTSTAVIAADSPITKAETLVHSLAAGEYTSVEATFNAQMQQGLPAKNSRMPGNSLLLRLGLT